MKPALNEWFIPFSPIFIFRGAGVDRNTFSLIEINSVGFHELKLSGIGVTMPFSSLLVKDVAELPLISFAITRKYTREFLLGFLEVTRRLSDHLTCCQYK
jgi:hypothetical protein